MSMRGGEAGFGDDDGDRLPWLETVEEDYSEGPSLWRVLLLVLLGLAVVAAGVFGWYWYTRQRNLVGNGALIQAPAGDYKVKPEEPGGMTVAGEGDQVFATSEGAPANVSVNVAAQPEAPIDGMTIAPAKPGAPGRESVSVAVPANGGRLEAKAPGVTEAPKPVTRAAGGGSLIQLGAFPDEGGANAAWARLSKRFKYLEPLGRSVVRGESEGKAIWRLRVNAGSNDQATDLCNRLKTAGESCYVAN